jgi:tetratricopeptide (TPR) repeat protein
MGIFDRFRPAGQAIAASGKNSSEQSGQDATRLIDQGLALEAQGRLNEARQCYLEAIRLAPNPARAHLNHGNILLLQGDLNGALDAFSTALKYKPDYAGAYYNIGNALLGSRQFDEAATNYRRALEIQPDYAEAHCGLGVALKELGQLDSAIASFQTALKINPDLAEAHLNLGNALQAIGQFESAITSYHHALKINPHHAQTHNNLGIMLNDLDQLEDALNAFKTAIKYSPDYAEAHNNLGNALQNLEQNEGAASCYRRALQIKPDYAEAYSNLGVVLQKLGQLDEALVALLQALQIKPDFAEAHNNLGFVMNDLGQSENAATSYRRAIEINPDFIDAQFNLGLLLLSLGQYAEAWPKYEARYHPNTSANKIIPPEVAFPQWQGESLAGKSLMIWTEQGFGDEIQFARYIPMLKARGASLLTLVCKQPLITLLEQINGVDAVVPPSEAASLPFHDYWAFPMSLPLHFATTVETIPAELPYLDASPERLNRWRDRLPPSGLKVGLVWKGNAEHKNDANRSLPGLSTMANLWSVPGVAFVSLQKGPGEDEASSPPTGQPILNLGSDIQDFADTAAIVAQLDLVICIDTSIAHLAGALGKTCWVLLPALGTDWRWLKERMDTPWYPGVMRLFRQTKTRDWAATIIEVTRALETWVDDHANSA